MFGINLKHSLAIVAVAAGVLSAAGSASAGTHQSGVIAYNGHAGLGASVHQHNQSDLEFLAASPQGPGADGFWLGSNDALTAAVSDGTSNTIMFGERAATSPAGTGTLVESPGKRTAVIESLGTQYTMFSGDAYDDEMGLRAARLLPDVDDEVL